MRWERLFDDLEGQLEHELGSSQHDFEAEEERLRLGRLSIRERLMAIASAAPTVPPVRIQLIDGSAVVARPITFGKDWLSAELVVEGDGSAAQCVLPLPSILTIVVPPPVLRDSLRPAASGRPERIVDRIGFGFVLRDLCRRRANVKLSVGSGEIFGTIDRVGRDHLDIAMHEPGSPRRAGNVGEIRLVPLAAILLVTVGG